MALPRKHPNNRSLFSRTVHRPDFANLRNWKINPRHSNAFPSKTGSFGNGGIRLLRQCLPPDSSDSLLDDSHIPSRNMRAWHTRLTRLPTSVWFLFVLTPFVMPITRLVWRLWWWWPMTMTMASPSLTRLGSDDLLCARRSFSGDDDRCRDLRDFLSPCPFEALASDVLSVCFGRLSIPQPLPSFSIFCCRISWCDIRGPREVCAFRMPSSCDGSWTSWPLCSLCGFMFSGSMSHVLEWLSSSTETSSSSLSAGSSDVKPGPVKKTSGRRR